MMTNYSFFGPAEHDFDRLQKKYRTLPADLERFCKFTLKLEADKSFPASNKNYALLKITSSFSLYKARIPCVSLRGNKLRIVYARHKQSIEFIVIELYPKNEKPREDQRRIAAYLEQYQ
ncbi:MAG: hypothetical protein WC353_03560 [Candidatus Peribacter sp.]|jgi:hypothetical protein